MDGEMSEELNDSSDCETVVDDATAVRSLAIPLALSIAGANSRISGRQSRVVEAWGKRNGAISPESGRAGYIFAKIIARLIAFFPDRHVTRTVAFGQKIAGVASFATRCSIFELCLLVVRAGGFASVAQLMLLKGMAYRFDIKMDRFRSMMERIIPVTMHEVVDMEICLGVTREMDRSGICHQLSKEYRKWNSRVTNSNRQVRTEAEYMLNLVAQTRKLYEK